MKLKPKKSILVVLGALLVFSILVIGAEEEPVNFGNYDVKLSIKQQLGKAVGEVYPSDLKQLTELDLQNEKIENLKWFKYCENLERLVLLDNGIKDISFLSNFTNLKHLVVFQNNISDLSPLSGLYKLRGVLLRHNNITDIQPLVDNFKVKESGEEIGLGEGDRVNLRDNNLDLSEGSEDLQDIQTLLDRGVEVEYYPQKD